MPDSRISDYGRLILLVLTVTFLIYTLASTSLYSISTTELGLVSKLPLAFWIGLVLLFGLWFSCLKGPSKYQILALALTISYLYVAPAIIRTPVWVSESFYPYGESLLINSQGHLVTRDYAPLVSYQDWPVFLYFASNLKLVTGLPDTVILKYFPMFTVSMYAVLTFLILRLKLKTSFAVLGATLLLSSFFTRQQYFGPQGMAYVFFLLIVFVMCQLFFVSKTKERTLVALFLFLFAVITLTHALTALMTLVVLVAVYLGHRIFKVKPPAVAARLCIFSALLLFSYNMFFAPGFFNLSVERWSEFIAEIWEHGLAREASRIPGSPAQAMSYITSWGIVLLTSLIAAIQAVYVVVRSRKQPDKEKFSVSMVVWLVLVFVFAVTSVYGSNEAYQRAFMFGLIPLSYLCVRLLSKRPRILLLFVCGVLLLNIPAQYGSDTYRLATDAVLTGTGFFVHSTPQNITCLYHFFPHIRYFDPLKYVVYIVIPGTLPFTSVPNSTTVERTLSRAEYIIRSDLQHNYYMYFLRQDPFDQVDFSKFNRIYDDQSFRTFMQTNVTSLP